MRPRVRTAILISGRGSNMMSLVKAAQDPDYPAEISCVISNRPDAAGLQKAATAGIDAISVDHKAFPNRRAFEEALDGALQDRDIQFIACAGFMRVLTPWFVDRWDGKLINIHPSLLPKYKGLHTHQRALEAGDSYAGATVHWVVSEVDGGDIIDQVKVPILDDDTHESLQARVLEQELNLYPKALKSAINSTLGG